MAENTQFVHACVLAEIDVMALLAASGEKSSKFSMGNPSSDLPVGSMSAGARGKAGGVEKIGKRRFVRAPLADHSCRFSVPTRETCVRFRGDEG